jgi:hypothetical protein
MEGMGELKHNNGKEFNGYFRRNYFLQDKCFINPLEEEKRTKKTVKIFEESVLANKEKVQYEKRLRLMKVQTGDDLRQAMEAT